MPMAFRKKLEVYRLGNKNIIWKTLTISETLPLNISHFLKYLKIYSIYIFLVKYKIQYIHLSSEIQISDTISEISYQKKETKI